ncbi:conserved hypothetical protein [Acidothermus cellulolyticus 11B]|uniref:DUF3499 domain-containing protein n=1 Tax=Acidothermus cellulolyticus (strain ATCC 43068 / DSM 8971 / 11B) TaxID=351607 RepID=A0LS27_ACIC1|nr:conserved hypothetical protein [Acidothermus cellulolyticus 11B]
MSPLRRCCRAACGQPAVATLTYVYADSTAVLGPLATYAEPHSYDLCSKHSARLTAPLGWEIIRLEISEPPAPGPDDLVALADAIREAGRQPAGGVDDDQSRSQGRRGHLRVLRSPEA